MKYNLYDRDTDTEQTVTVKYRHHRAWRGARDKYGAPLEPDEPEDIEVMSITAEDGTDMYDEVSPEEWDKIVEACWDDWRGYLDTAADAKYEEEKERRIGL